MTLWERPTTKTESRSVALGAKNGKEMGVIKCTEARGTFSR